MPQDLELVRGHRFKPEEPSREELDAISKLDKVDYSIFTSKLEMACREAREGLKKLGISSFIKAGDTAHGIYTANGDLSIADVGTYIHVVDCVIPIKFVLKHYANDPTVGMRDGDIFFCNEALYGGIHNPDMITFLPVYFGSELIAWVAAASHEPETGATEPGGMSNTAKTRYDEGLKVPPIKIGENFKLKKDIVELFENNVRYPLMITNDQAARVAVCLRLRSRILDIAEKKGKEFVIGVLRKIILDTAEVVKERIRMIPDGKFSHVAFLDTTGFAQGLVRLPVTMMKKGEKITFDLRHASPQVPGPFNAFEHMVEAAFASNIFQYFLNDVPASGGCLIPFEFLTTPGSCLNANPDAAIAQVVYLAPVLINAIQILLIKALYSVEEFRKDEYIALPLSGALRALIISGENQLGRTMTNVLLVLANSRGAGARHEKDGVDSAGFWYCGFAEAVDCEQDESTFPVVTLWRSFDLDAGGPGKFCGGRGVSFGYVVNDVKTLSLTSIGTGHRFPITHGVFGGYPARTSPVMIFKNGLSKVKSLPRVPSGPVELARIFPDESLLFPNAIPLFTIQNGDLVSQSSGGGGGYGDVLERDPELVRSDLILRKISEWTARNVYKVVFEDNSFQIDREKTEKLRNEERKSRIARGRPYLDFLIEWEKKRPAEEALLFYGDWPVPFPDTKSLKSSPG